MINRVIDSPFIILLALGVFGACFLLATFLFAYIKYRHFIANSDVVDAKIIHLEKDKNDLIKATVMFEINKKSIKTTLILKKFASVKTGDHIELFSLNASPENVMHKDDSEKTPLNRFWVFSFFLSILFILIELVRVTIRQFN